MRLSYRQPQSLVRTPEPRAPRFLREIVDLGHAVDEWPLQSAAHQIGKDEFPAFLKLFYSPRRTLPILCVSEDWRTNSAYADTEKLAKLLAGAAHVILLGAEAAWDLSREVGHEWSTFQGAVRCYNPQPDLQADKYKHRLWLADSIQRTDASGRDAFVNLCVRHVFTQINARFESESLLTPATLRRRHDEQSLPLQLEPKLVDTPTLAFESSLSEPAEIAISPEVVTAQRLFQEQMDKVLFLTDRVDQLEKSNEKLERDLQEERSAHANARKASDYHQGMVELYQQEEGRDNEVRRLLNGDISQETSEVLKPLYLAFGPFLKALNNTAIYLRAGERDLDEERRRREEAEDARAQLSGKLRAREGRLEGEGQRAELSPIVELIPRLVRDPSLTDSLNCIERCFPERVLVLESARKAAAGSAEFRKGHKAFDLLWKLATEYWERLQISGAGDSDAKSVFGSNYAPRESDKLSKGGKRQRTFDYDGKAVLMEKHLKIGVADNPSDTLRVHFEWVAEEKRIVIGHCGRHLAL